jgi:transcriptional adapter 2-alpha
MVFSQELHSYPIFSDDWGADEYVIISSYHLKSASTSHHARELLLIEGISKAGLGNWQMIAEHVGTRTKEEVEEHYNSVYVDSPDWPLPVSG